jgi:4-methylaminobutanoate oxidase (formaldehyde-forming)
VIGASVAYHLGEAGWSDVVLVERDRLTSGTTWHAAGLMVTFGSMSATSTELRRYTRDLYARLESETGHATGFAPVGFVELATSHDRLEEYRRVAAFNRHLGVEVTEIGPGEVADLFPIARTNDVLAGFHVAGDGRVNPVDVTMALAAGARRHGARVTEGVAVTGLRAESGAVRGVDTTAGPIEADYVVLCTGMWTRQLAATSGITVPLQAAEHYYLVTEPIAGVERTWPVIEDPSSFGYYREEGGGLLIGLFEPECAPWHLDRVPDAFSFGEITPDWDRMGPYVETAMRRVPVTFDVGIRKFFCGPESFTPDLRPAVGETPELANCFVAAGLNSIGILTGGGIGRLVARWIVDGRPDLDVTEIDVDRLHPYQATPEYRRLRTVESLGMVYQAHYPTRAPQTARGAKRSPLHERLAARGASFREVSGWESPDWYVPAGASTDPGPWSWGRHHWFEHWRSEHDAVRNDVAVIDMSFMAKFTVEGPDAGRLLERLSTNRVDGRPQRITYTQWLNERGGIEADLTVTKIAEERFLVVATDTAHRHVATWMGRHAAGLAVTINDVSGTLAQLNVQGPRSRDVLQAVTSADLSNGAFPFRTARTIDVGFAEVLCVRITYVGELGYELYVPVEQAAHVHEHLADLPHAGLRALGSLRLEKAYRDYGHDIDNTDNVFSGGLDRFADLTKESFIGRDCVAAGPATKPPFRALVQVLLSDPEPLLHHGEVVHCDGRDVGYLRSASYGHTLGGAVGLAMVHDDEPISQGRLDAATWEVDVAGTLHPAKVSLDPMYDPAMHRIRT